MRASVSYTHLAGALKLLERPFHQPVLPRMEGQDGGAAAAFQHARQFFQELIEYLDVYKRQPETEKKHQDQLRRQDAPQPAQRTFPPHDRNTLSVSKSASRIGMLTARIDSFPKISIWVPRAP